MEFEIIDFVKANPILWERKYNTINNRPYKAEKWRELGRLMKRDPNVVRGRWRSLRDNYRKQLNTRCKDRRNGDDALAHGVVSKYYNYMTFLNSEYSEDSELDTSRENAEEVLYIIEPLDETTVDLEVDDINLIQFIEKENDNSFSPVETTQNKDNLMNDEKILQSKRKHTNKDIIVTEACEQMSALLQSAKKNFVPPTHNQVFFNSVAMQVEQAQMPPMDLMRLQQKILELIAHELVTNQEKSQAIK